MGRRDRRDAVQAGDTDAIQDGGGGVLLDPTEPVEAHPLLKVVQEKDARIAELEAAVVRLENHVAPPEGLAGGSRVIDGENLRSPIQGPELVAMACAELFHDLRTRLKDAPFASVRVTVTLL